MLKKIVISVFVITVGLIILNRFLSGKKPIPVSETMASTERRVETPPDRTIPGHLEHRIQARSTPEKATAVNADLVRIAFSSILLAFSLWAIASSKVDPDAKKWAFGVVGSLIGFWLK